MEFYRTVEHPLVTKLEPEIAAFVQATFNFHWKRRPKDMTHNETAHLHKTVKGFGVALNYLRLQLKVEREFMAQLLFMSPGNYTQLELRGSPVRREMADQLADFCATRGMKNLAMYFRVYVGIKERKKNNGYGPVVPIER